VACLLNTTKLASSTKVAKQIILKTKQALPQVSLRLMALLKLANYCTQLAKKRYWVKSSGCTTKNK